MATVGNNMNGKASHLRDAFFDSADEKEYFEKLKQNPKEMHIHCELLRDRAENLYHKALEIIQKVEEGKFNEEQMAKAERVIAHCLAAIEDIHPELILERTPDLEMER